VEFDFQKIARYFVKTILLVLAFIPISPALDGNDSAEINALACAAKNTLNDLTISSIATVFAASLLVGFNPCILAILAFLASSMLVGRIVDILAMIVTFSLGMFVVYINYAYLLAINLSQNTPEFSAECTV